MPKIKTNRGAAKRFTRTASGAFKRKRAFKNHILTKKSPKTIRQLRSGATVHDSDKAAVEKMLPNG